MHWLKTSILPPIIVSIVVGMATGYLTVEKTISGLERDVEALKRADDELRAKDAEFKRSFSAYEDRERDSNEKLVRLETKIDMLLERRP